MPASMLCIEYTQHSPRGKLFKEFLTHHTSGEVTDEEEVRAGIAIADLALECGVRNFVNSSGAAVGDKPTGIGHFDSKMRIEAHIRTLAINATIIRPAAFMEMFVMPGFGLDQGRFSFFMRDDQTMQLLAVEDIGKFVQAVFSDPVSFGGQTFEIASDAVTGKELEVLFSEAVGPIRYARFAQEVLASSPFLAKLAALTDEGPLAGHADLCAMRNMNPSMRSLREWLAETGKDGFHQALGTTGKWDYDR